VQIASSSFVGLRGRTAATVLLTIGFSPPEEGLDVIWRDRPHLVARLPQLPRPVVRTATSLHADQARGKARKNR
jgi:hypothetical protein